MVEVHVLILVRASQDVVNILWDPGLGIEFDPSREYANDEQHPKCHERHALMPFSKASASFGPIVSLFA